MTGLYIAASLVCMLLSAFFSAAEMALSSANVIRLENMAEDGNKAAACAIRVLNKFDGALSAILIGNNFANIALSSLSSVIAISTFGEKYTWLATIISTVAVISLCETMPKIVAKKNANRWSLSFAYIVRGLQIVFSPLIFVVVKFVNLLTSFKSGDGQEHEQDAAIEELQSIIDIAEDEDVLDEDRSELLHAALDFNEICAFEVMTARVDTTALDIDDSWEENFEIINSSPYSRLPVYQDSIDNIIGVLYLNHFFRALLDNDRVDIRSLLMTPCYIYKTQKLPAVLSQFRRSKKHLAIVTDEYGGTLGVISMEDVLEEIVGDIWDESDTIEDELVELPDGVFEMGGDMAMGDFIETLELEESEFDFDSATVGGWTLETFGDYPKVGDSFTYKNLTVTVLMMDGMRVEKILVKRNGKED